MHFFILAKCLSHTIRVVLNTLTIYGEEYKLCSSPLELIQFSPFFCYFLFHKFKYSQRLFLRHLNSTLFPQSADQISHSYKTATIIVLYVLGTILITFNCIHSNLQNVAILDRRFSLLKYATSLSRRLEPVTH
jgi:hypothetical protein